MLAFTLNDTLVKAVLHDGVPLYQVIALRGLGATFGLCLIALQQNGRLGLWPDGRDRLYLVLRTIGEIGATWSFLLALSHMPLANLSAILQSLPLVVTLIAALFLGESIGWRRICAIVVGFIGVMVIIRPGAADFDQWSVLGLISVAFVVLRDLATRKFTKALPSTTGAIWAALAVLTLGAVGLTQEGWQPISAVHLAEIAGAAAFLIAGYLCAIKVMRVGEISVVAPFRYTSLLWAILLGWLLFDTLPDRWTLLGGAITVASGLFILQRQARVKAGAEPLLTSATTPPRSRLP